jgi:hypothetical protein
MQSLNGKSILSSAEGTVIRTGLSGEGGAWLNLISLALYLAK